MEYKTNPVKAIREFCIDCCGGSRETVKVCPSVKCALYPFRMGKNPFRQIRQKKELTEEQKAAIVERLNNGKKNKNNNVEEMEENDE
jgi:hypothetical protein